MQPKARTLQERMGFRDDELSTPRHDEIMMWLDENVLKTLSLEGPWKYKSGEVDSLRERCGIPIPGDPPEREINVKRIWERPVTSGSNGFSIGFVDMEVIGTEFRLDFSEMNGICRWDRNLTSTRIFSHMIEVKPSIRSLGEVIRQVRFYEVYCPGSKFYICCPDNRFEKHLAAQGIGFIRAEV